jgi:RNA polymerase sigma factor for flagellar operon FliA
MSIVDVDPYLAMQWERWLKRRSSSARDHLIVSYAPLVKFVAGRVGAGLPGSVDPGDLVSSGVLGLIDAIERFDPQRGVKFETFATPRIRGAIYDGLRELDWVPRSVRSRSREVEKAIAELESSLGRTPSDAEVAAHLGVSREQLRQWLSAIASTTIGPLERALDLVAVLR